MTIEYYAAPMEGLTGWQWRQIHHEIFGGADRYFTPFLSPNANLSFQTKEAEDISPEHNCGLPVVPQILTNRAEYFIWAARELQERGYEEVNFNLGCPSGTVAAKGKGAGFLSHPDALDACLEEIFTALQGLRISLKTRIGRNDTAEWPQLLQIYCRYPVSRLIVHPRVQKEFYRGRAHRDVFDATCRDLPVPLCYNGDLFSVPDVREFEQTHPQVSALMLGRGLMTDPSLLRRLRGGEGASRAELQTYHDRLYEAFRERMSGDLPVLHRMWEHWAWLGGSFEGAEPYLKGIRKAKSCAAYLSAAHALLRECPMREAPQVPLK